jgi:hypothetical protein
MRTICSQDRQEQSLFPDAEKDGTIILYCVRLSEAVEILFPAAGAVRLVIWLPFTNVIRRPDRRRLAVKDCT